MQIPNLRSSYEKVGEIVFFGQILERLCQEAKALGFQRIVLETTSTWSEVIAFYKRFGFRITHHRDGHFGGEVHFALDLTSV